jgi:hypothetical protein
MGNRATFQTVSPERTHLQNGTDSPIYERCLEKDESATHVHIQSHSVVTASLRFCHLGHYFMEPVNHKDALVCKLLLSAHSVELLSS